VTPVIELADVSKDYRGLRPLRIQSLTVDPGELVALIGFDRVSAEVFVNLVTGASLPDAGSVSVFGRATNTIDDSSQWLALVDRFGIVSERVVLLDGLTVLQNLAIPFTLEIEPLSAQTRGRTAALAREIGVQPDLWETRVGDLDAAVQMQVRWGRALALDPGVLLLEHASAPLTPAQALDLAARIKDVATRRRTAVISLGVDERFANRVSRRVLTLEPSSGRLKRRRWMAFG
jgi:ABC-type transporter Mla maintaining outer membrane lipid asymmetry ATPase subunit MlaF